MLILLFSIGNVIEISGGERVKYLNSLVPGLSRYIRVIMQNVRLDRIGKLIRRR